MRGIIITLLAAASATVLTACMTSGLKDPAAERAPGVVHVTDEEFREEVLKDGPALVEFWAAYCPSCRKMNPVMDELALELHGSCKVVMVDIKTNVRWASKYEVKLIPTFIYFVNGEVAGRAVGAMPREKLLDMLDIDVKTSTASTERPQP